MKLDHWLSQERGRSKALAEHLRVPASFVCKVAKGVKSAPLEHCPYIELFTNRQVTCEELRPDQAGYFAVLRGLGQSALNDASIKPPSLAVSSDAATEKVAQGVAHG